MLEISAGMARSGAGVRVLSGGPASLGEVVYMSPDRAYLDSSNLGAVNIFVIMFIHLDKTSLGELEDLTRRLTHPNLKVLLWCPCIWSKQDADVIQEVLHRPVTLIGVSKYVDRCMQHHALPYFEVPNAINPDIFGNKHAKLVQRQPRSFIFTACYERGGHTAREVHDLLTARGHCMGGMNVYSYFDTNLAPSLSKRELAERLKESEYMVYPLTLQNAEVHHDTFACVILEAMACGVLVVTWDVACMRDVYGDMITLVSPPPCDGYDPQAAAGSNPMMIQKDSVVKLADAVSGLIALSEEDRETRRLVAREWALNQTWQKSVDKLSNIVRQLHL